MNPIKDPNATDWNMIAAIGQCVGALAAVVSLIGIGILIWQIRDNRKWNKLNLAFTFLPSPVEFDTVEQEINKVINLWGRSESDPLVTAEIKALFGKSLENHDVEYIEKRYGTKFASDEWTKVGRRLKLYMNLIEEYCTAINIGAADSDAAYRIYSYKFKSHYNKLKTYIDWIRKDRNENGLYSEFEHLVKVKWFPEGKPPKTGY